MNWAGIAGEGLGFCKYIGPQIPFDRWSNQLSQTYTQNIIAALKPFIPLPECLQDEAQLSCNHLARSIDDDLGKSCAGHMSRWCILRPDVCGRSQRS